MSGLYVQSFGFVGHNRRGAPVSGYVKTDREPIESKQVEEPDFYVVMDAAAVDFKQFKENSVVILNTPQKPISDQLRKKKIKIYAIDATEIALNIMKTNVPNTVMLGAITKLFNKVSMKAIRTALEAEGFARENVAALEEGYRNVK